MVILNRFVESDERQREPQREPPPQANNAAALMQSSRSAVSSPSSSSSSLSPSSATTAKVPVQHLWTQLSLVDAGVDVARYGATVESRDLNVDEGFMMDFVAAIDNSDGEMKMDDARPAVESRRTTAIDTSQSFVSTSSQRRTYGQTRVSEDHKRERNRETFKRFYHRKQQILRELREEELSLDATCKSLVETRVAAGKTDTKSSMHTDYIDLTAQRYQLLAEKAALGELLERRLKGQLAISRVVTAFSVVETSASSVDRFEYVRSTAPIDYQRVIHTGMENLTQVQEQIADVDFQDESFGWRCWRQKRGGCIEYQLQKQFSSNQHGADVVAARTWEFCTRDVPFTDSRSRREHRGPSSSLQTRRKFIRYLDESHASCLIYRLITPAHRAHEAAHEANQDSLHSLLLKSVYVVSTVKHPQIAERSFTILSHSVDDPKSALENADDLAVLDDLDFLDSLTHSSAQGCQVLWTNDLNWWRVDDQGSIHGDLHRFQVTFLGRVGLLPGVEDDLWLTEALRTVVQWEEFVLGQPPVLACPP